MTNLQPNTQSRNPGGQPGNHNAAKPDAHVFLPPLDPEPARKRGAPFGNTNAVTYGFYSRRLSPLILEGLEDTTEFSLKDEIEVMRVFARKLAELGADINDVHGAKSLLNALSTATNAINRLVRTHTHIPNPEDDPGAILKKSLEELEEEWPEYKKFGDKFRTPEQIAELDARIAARQAREEEARLNGEYVDEDGNPYPLNGLIEQQDECEE